MICMILLRAKLRGHVVGCFLFWLAKTRLNYHMELRWSCICVYVGVVYMYMLEFCTYICWSCICISWSCICMLLLSFSWKEVVLLGKISFGYRVVSRLKDLECICLLLFKV